MRLNKFIARASGLSRRAADRVIAEGRVQLNGASPTAGASVDSGDQVQLDGQLLKLPDQTITIMLNKPIGYVVSRNGQGSKTVYELLPLELKNLKPVGRLDKNSSGLLLLTNDGVLAHELTHPRFAKEKIYEIILDKPLTPAHLQQITQTGVTLEDGPSTFQLHWHQKNDGLRWVITMHEGRNRQIRRTFETLGYKVTKLHRTQFGSYSLGVITPGRYKTHDV